MVVSILRCVIFEVALDRRVRSIIVFPVVCAGCGRGLFWICCGFAGGLRLCIALGSFVGNDGGGQHRGWYWRERVAHDVFECKKECSGRLEF